MRGWVVARTLAATTAAVLALAGAAHADTDADARAHFKSASKAFDLGHFDQAIKEYEAAYQLRSEPAILFDLAQAHRQAGHIERALFFYKMYLQREPNAPKRQQVEARIAALRVQVGDDPALTRELERGAARFTVGDYDGARAIFARLLEQAPDRAALSYWLGVTDEKLQQCARAAPELDAFLERCAPADSHVADATAARDRCRAAPPPASPAGEARTRISEGRILEASGWATAGAGGAVGLIGISFGLAPLAECDLSNCNQLGAKVAGGVGLLLLWSGDLISAAAGWRVRGGLALVGEAPGRPALRNAGWALFATSVVSGVVILGVGIGLPCNQQGDPKGCSRAIAGTAFVPLLSGLASTALFNWDASRERARLAQLLAGRINF